MLIVADPHRIVELVNSLAEPLPQGVIDVLVSSGGDDTIDLFEARRPYVVVVTATLEAGDSKALVEALRGMAPRAEVAVVLIGDDEGPVKTAIDAMELAPERFVTSPVSAKALRFAVGTALEAVALVRTSTPDRSAPIHTPPVHVDDDPTASRSRRARWEALADSFAIDEDELTGSGDEAAPLPPPIQIKPRRRTDPPVDAEIAPMGSWRPGNTSELVEREVSGQWSAPEPPVREPTLIIRDPEPSTPAVTSATPIAPALDERDKETDHWSGAVPLAQLVEREPRHDDVLSESVDDHDDLGISLDAFDDELVVGHTTGKHPREPRLEILDDLPDAEPAPPALVAVNAAQDGRDFARQLRAKMSMMAQRLFQGTGAEPGSSPAVDLGPRHDHHTEIDLASLGEEPALDRGVTEIESRAMQRAVDARDLTTSPGSWDTQIHKRGLPDSGEIQRGLSDAAMLLAKMFAQASTGRIAFRQGQVEKVVYFDQGRPVFASSSETRDRMGELLVREGKITAAQYERCQTVVAESGRRMGEILVDFGYLKRRELLPAVRRHVEDIVYSLFGWDRGTYHTTIEQTASAERIRLSRHPAALILEGIRRKLDRSSLERLIGSASTVIEVPDRERLGGIINLGDLAPEERGALAAFDGQADLSSVARTAGVDVTDVLPLAWGLCVLGLATARRTDTEVPDESSALVGETDLAIDRERVRARWQLVDEADYFAVLGVRRDATTFEIRRAYQAARRDFAADFFPNDLRRELAQELDDIAHVLDEAFRVLRDDRLRNTYLANLIE